MLIKKDSNNIHGSAAIIPLTTARCKDGPTTVYNDNPTFAFKSFISNDNIYFPGTNTVIYCDHQNVQYEPLHFDGYKQVKIGDSYAGGSTDAGTYTYSYSAGDAFQNLQAAIANDNAFKFEFNRIYNWFDYVSNDGGYTDPRSAYLNFYGPESQTAVQIYPSNVTESFVRSAGKMKSVVGTNVSRNTWPNWVNRYNEFEFMSFSTALSGTKQIISGEIYAYYNGSYQDSGTFVCEGLNVSSYRIPSIPSANNCRSAQAVSAGVTITSLYFQKDGVDLWDRTLYTSGLTATLNIHNKVNNSYFASDDLYFYFDTTGDDVIGTVHRNAQYTTVTANVRYDKNINGTVTHNVTEYSWYNSTGYQVNLGGGGKWQSSVIIDPVERDTKFILYPKNKVTANVTDDGRTFTLTPNNYIPDYYGGVMLFSGAGLDNEFNRQETLIRKRYFCIGMKGIAASSTSDFSTNYTYNWGCKLYKFNDEHFKKISTNTYCFFDDQLCNLHNTLDYNDYSGNQTRTFTPIGPFFMKLSAETTYTDDDGSMSTSPFSVRYNEILAQPDMLNTMNYITSAKLESNVNSRYLITKPAGSIYYQSMNSGHDVNRGNTDNYSYLAIEYPISFIVPNVIRFNRNITEITNLGTTMSSVSSIQRNAYALSQLTAIKSDWTNCINLISADLVFAYAPLTEIPSSWKGLSSLCYANRMFEGCTRLTDIPTDLFTYCTSLNNFTAMFKDCTSLTSDIEPILIAGNNKYHGLYWLYGSSFMGCTGVRNYNTLTANNDYKPWFGIS